jgi:hypothetical protein
LFIASYSARSAAAAQSVDESGMAEAILALAYRIGLA